LDFNVPFQHKYGYIRDESVYVVDNMYELMIYEIHITTNKTGA